MAGVNLRMSDAEILKFVEYYRNEPSLWDPTDDRYKKRETRAAAAHRIAEALHLVDFTASHVITKFKNLRSSHTTDTCSSCDEYKAQMSILEKGPFQKDALSRLDRDHQLHLLKADAFYKRKRTARLQSQKNIKMEAIAMDFQKNLPIPNISTNDVYYKRQLSFYSFNIHVLSSGESLFYTYTETAGKKGSDEVASMLFDFIFNHLDNAVEELEIFCDSCCGQNKNYTLFRLIHFVVHTTKLGGHSYMECDRNMGLINQKACVELPSDWNEQITSARVKPSPFQVINCEDQGLFRSWTTFLAQLFLKKCPFESRPIKELAVSLGIPRMIQHRETYNGIYTSSVVVPPKRKRENFSGLPGQFELPNLRYSESSYNR
ncbi:hypothetical protein RI129_002880 [Pyrocoelia pectoralis]|uniref:MADF domain-containing protein n=1 Tax=Pyrocoelia pectoralis TaxID=417401 RepID=A0AAN7VNV6_9COLE